MEEITDFKKGYNSLFGKVTNIYYRSNNFVIYETDKSGNIVHSTSDIDIKCTIELHPLLIQIDSLLTSRKERRKYASTVAVAYADCFRGIPESGKNLLQNLIPAIQKYKKLKSRLGYMLSALSFVVLNIILCTLINTVWLESLNKYLIILFTIGTFGSLGGLISILIKIPKLELDIEGTTFLQVLDGFSRIFLSMISSIIIFVLIKSNIFLGIINDINDNNVYYAFAIVSGFSETFIPDIIKSIEKDKLDK